MVEQIPSEHEVSRYIDSPEKWDADELRFKEDRLFLFKQPDYAESVVWRKYAPAILDVHQLGCERQKHRRAISPHWTYQGAITASVQSIRNIRGNHAGDTFEVVHAPDEGVHHAHIEMRLSDETALLKQRKVDLKERLRLVFSDLDPHTCR
jgi:hypothetical protein